ncbi:hypothetical protein [Kitasatospora sp. NPDC093558]|uniref:hypothetical protein n=1 Tax=Kitasatospora sp. NPDC093558 TaxID=3155201 RepID=UPI00343860EC
MHRLTHRALGAAAACAAAALLVSCTGEPDRTPAAASTPAASTPAARQDGGATLPLVAGDWGGGRSKAPPQRLDWGRPAGLSGPGADAGRPVRVTVTAPAVPSYASFMLSGAVDASGIPDEDPDRQTVLACGTGITDPGCRITDNRDGSFSVEVVGAPPADRPYRVLYVQWAPTRPGAEETWASWQLPLR